MRGVGERTVVQLEEAGYKSISELLREDEDRLGIKSGLGVKKVRALRQSAKEFVQNERLILAEARRVALAAGATLQGAEAAPEEADRP